MSNKGKHLKTKPKIEIDLDKVRNYAAMGLSKEKIALCLGISPTTLYERQKESEEFMEAIKSGQAQGEAVVVNELMKLARGGNLGAICFYLKCRGGGDWKERLEVENHLQGEVTTNVKLEGVKGWAEVFEKMKPPKS